MAATESYSLFPPNITCLVNREVVGIVTKIDEPKADVLQAERWLRLAGCNKIFRVNAKEGDGISDILEYLKEDGEVLPWERQEKQQKNQ